jgi:hypothetical protein
VVVQRQTELLTLLDPLFPRIWAEAMIDPVMDDVDVFFAAFKILNYIFILCIRSELLRPRPFSGMRASAQVDGAHADD